MGAGDASPLVAPNEKAGCGFCELDAEASFLPKENVEEDAVEPAEACLLYTSPSPRDRG